MSYIRKNLGEYTFIFLILIIGLGVSFTLFHLKQSYDQHALQDNFKVIAKERMELIEDAFDDSLALTDSFVAFYDSSHSVEREEFSTYAKRMLKNYPYVRFAGWLPYITNADRQKFEADAQADLPGFHLQDLTANGLVSSQQSR